MEFRPEPGHSRAGNNSDCLNMRKNHYLLSLVGQEDKDKNMVSKCHLCKQTRQREGKGALMKSSKKDLGDMPRSLSGSQIWQVTTNKFHFLELGILQPTLFDKEHE